MTDKELRKLRRSELLEIMFNFKSEADRLKQENEKLKLEINEKSVSLEKSGNIAEASLKLSGIFEAAQRAADIYIRSIKETYENRDRIILEAKTEADRIIKDAYKKADEITKAALDK